MNLLPILIAVGTYTAQSDSEGIYIIEIDFQQQQSRVVETLQADNPSFLHYAAVTSTLYYVEEIGVGTVNSAKLNRENISFEEINSLTTGGAGPCHVTISPDGTTLVAANYSGGSLSTFQRDRMELLSASFQHIPFMRAV